MRRQSLVLLTLLLTISGWILYARWSATAPVAASELPATEQATPLPPMPTPALTQEAETNWPVYTSPYWGISFRYPPTWEVNEHATTVNYPEGTTDTQRLARSIGSPIMLSPTEPGEGSLYLLLKPYTLSTEGSLVDWITLENEYSGMNSMWGFYPVHLSTIPATYLPAGIRQGIYSVNKRPANPTRTIWLERDGLVYMFGSLYNRPEDMANIFAIVATMEFDRAAEEKLRTSGGFQGDEEFLRQQIADMQPEPTPECDDSCQGERFMIENYVAPAATAKALPPLERPRPQPYSPLPVGDDWITYEQPVLGITFRYPPTWFVNDALKEYNLDDSAARRTGLSLSSDHQAGNTAFVISLSPYTLGKDTPLSNWEAIYDQLRRAGQRDDNFNFPYRLITPIDPIYFPRQANDMLYTDRIFISVNQVVYEVGFGGAVGAAVLSTLEFDEAHLDKLKAIGVFEGDERTMITRLVDSWVTPTPTPIPIPTPTVRATVTPSAFESPLANGLQSYQGNASYPEMSPFKLFFDPAIWQLTANEGGTHYLVHQQLAGCEINLDYAPFETLPLAPVALGGHAWHISYFTMDGSDALGYYLGWDNGSYMFTLILSEPLALPYDANNKSQCQLDGEAVFDTLSVVETAPLGASLPTVTSTP